MGEKKGAIFLAVVVVVMAAFFIYAIEEYFPGLLSSIFLGASETVETGFDSVNG